MTYDSIISDADAALLRDPTHILYPRVMNVVPKTVVASAQLSGTPTLYPVISLPLTNATDMTNVQTDMLVLIGTSTGAFDIGIGFVREKPLAAATSLTIDPKELGNPDSPLSTYNQFNPLIDGAYITIVKHYPLSTALSRIYNQVFYKRHAIPYSDQLSLLDPVANGGGWRQGFVGADGKLTLDFSLEDSIYWGDNNAIVGYSWDADGGIINGLSTDRDISITFNAGFYIVRGTVFDSNGKSHTCRIYVWANTTSGIHAPFSYRYPLGLSNIKSDRDGSEMRFKLNNAAHASEIYPTMGILYTEYPKYTAYRGEVSDEVAFMNFAGYLDAISINNTRVDKERTYKVISPIKYAKKLPNPAQQVSQRPNPVTWAEIKYLDPAIAFWYLGHWHCPSLIANHDMIIGKGVTNQLKQSFVWQAEGFSSQFRMIELLMLGNIGSKPDGSTILSIYPRHQLPDIRDALPRRFRFSTGDYADGVQYELNTRMNAGFAIGFSFTYDGNTNIDRYGAIAAGRVQAQAQGTATLDTFIAPITDGNGNPVDPSIYTRRMVGTHFAYVNREIDNFTIKHDRNLDIVDPADLRALFTFNHPDYGANDIDIVPYSINRVYKDTRNGLTKEITGVYEPLVKGQLGRPIDVSRGGASGFLFDGWVIEFPDFYQGNFPAFNDLENLSVVYMYACNSVGRIASTLNALAAKPIWTDCTNNLTGLVKTFDLVGQGQLMCVVTWEQATQTARIYHSDSTSAISAQTVWGLRHEFQITDEGFNGKFDVKFDRQSLGWAVLEYITTDGQITVRTQDNWANVTVGYVNAGTADDTNNNTRTPAVDYNDNDILSSGAKGDTQYDIYRAVNLASYSLVSGLPSDTGYSVEPSSVARINGTNAYITANIVDDTPTSEAASFSFVSNGDEIAYGGNPYPYVFESRYSVGGGDELAGGEAAIYGYDRRAYVDYWTDENKTVTIDGFTYNLGAKMYYRPDEADPPATSSTPNYFPPFMDGTITNYGDFSPEYAAMTFVGKILVLGKNNKILYETPQKSFILTDSGDPNFAIAYIGTGIRIIEITNEMQFTVDFTAQPLSGVIGIEAIIASTEPRNWGAGWVWNTAFLASYTRLQVQTTALDMNIVNVNTSGRRLYRVANFDSSPVYNDITPNGFVPTQQKSFAVDPDNGAKLANIGDFDNERRLYVSDDTGANWTNKGEIPLNGVKRYADTLLVYGTQSLAVSPDLGTTFYDRLGNWQAAVGAVGEILKVQIDYDAT